MRDTFQYNEETKEATYTGPTSCITLVIDNFSDAYKLSSFIQNELNEAVKRGERIVKHRILHVIEAK